MARTWTMDNVGDLIETVSRPVDPDRLSVFSIFRDERAFCPAFFAHYRSLGVEQFVIVDDGSQDGTREWLDAQPDAVVLRMKLGFGIEIPIRIDGRRKTERAGTYYKIALPNHFFDGQYVTYADADEFLLLPPGVKSLHEVVARLRAEGAGSAVANVVEFFPADAAGLQGALPSSLDGLIAAYPWFEPEPLVTLGGAEGKRVQGESKTARLFAHYSVEPKVRRRGLHRLWMPAREKKAQQFQKSARHKTPVVLRDDDNHLVDSHNANHPPSQTVLLTLAHFVFTAEFADKIARAVAWKAHASGAAKYRYYAELLNRVRDVPEGFLGPNSVRFEGPDQLVAAGLMRW